MAAPLCARRANKVSMSGRCAGGRKCDTVAPMTFSCGVFHHFREAAIAIQDRAVAAQADRALLHGLDQRPIGMVGPLQRVDALPCAVFNDEGVDFSDCESPAAFLRPPPVAGGVSGTSSSWRCDFPSFAFLCLAQIQDQEEHVPCSTSRPPAAAEGNGSFLDERRRGDDLLALGERWLLINVDYFQLVSTGQILFADRLDTGNCRPSNAASCP